MNEKKILAINYILSGSLWGIFLDNKDVILFILAALASGATIILTILTAIHLRRKYLNSLKEGLIRDEQLKQEEIRTSMLLDERKMKQK